MAELIKFPGPFRFGRTLTAREIYAVKEPPEEMVWEICPYIKSKLEACEHCPKTEKDPDHGDITKGCFVMASEACRVVLALKDKLK